MTVLFLVAVCCIPVWFLGGFIALITMDTGPDWLTGIGYVMNRTALAIGIGCAVLFALLYAAHLLPWHIEIGKR